MASLAQMNPAHLHCWRTPGHYHNCQVCRDFRSLQSRSAEAEASRAGRLSALAAGEPYRFRRLAISPRLEDRRLRSLFNQQLDQGQLAPRRHVTIQIPCLDHPVRPDETPRLPLTDQPSAELYQDSPSRKRPSTCTSTPDPAQFYVPGQFTDDLDDTSTSDLDHTKADPDFDFWAANAELIRQGAEERAAARERAQASTHPEPSTDYSSMPGTWPSWADDPNGVPPPPSFLAHTPARRLQVEHEEPIFRLPGPVKSLVTSLGSLSSFVFGGTIRAVRCVLQPAQSAQPLLGQPIAATSSIVNSATQSNEDDGVRVPKRPRFDARPPRIGYSQPRLSRSVPVINHAPTPYEVFDRNKSDPNFNHAGHFSLDALDDASDSEDDDNYPGSPMDIDSPPSATLNMTEAISAQHRINIESPPKLNSATAAARRAVSLFPKDSPVSKAPATPFTKGKALFETFPPTSSSSVTPFVERHRHKTTVASTSPDAHSPRRTEKGRYTNVLEFFPNDVVHSLPGLEEKDLPADALKVEHLKRELRERIRQEEIESQNAALTHLGVRRPKSTLIHEPSPEWVKRALDAPYNGTFDPKGVHPDAVELKPRDFAKLVPPTAWLNDDCVHSSLCCLAAYVNNKANVKPKVDPPKCVAVSSLYWNAFCQDNKKLYPRLFSRKWNLTPANFFDADTVLIPVNSNAHWTLIIIRPSRKTVSYMDSFHHRNERQLHHAYEWLKLFLGDKFVADDWETQEFGVPRQTNAWDCGVFVITNAMCLALGISPLCYSEKDMAIQRRRLAAVLLNGGFVGAFDLGNL
ncbi:hypothetical protein F5Y09DRAFT_347319 [Xylaria sp. FL1042]|nr:hypothetical protein F5Y09DRAFT_347319 [Xylaria sp. FL1042]